MCSKIIKNHRIDKLDINLSYSIKKDFDGFYHIYIIVDHPWQDNKSIIKKKHISKRAEDKLLTKTGYDSNIDEFHIVSNNEIRRQGIGTLLNNTFIQIAQAILPKMSTITFPVELEKNNDQGEQPRKDYFEKHNYSVTDDYKGTGIIGELKLNLNKKLLESNLVAFIPINTSEIRNQLK